MYIALNDDSVYIALEARAEDRDPSFLLPGGASPPYCWIHIAHFPVTSILNNGKIPFKEKHFQDSQWFLAQDKTVQSQG